MEDKKTEKQHVRRDFLRSALLVGGSVTLAVSGVFVSRSGKQGDTCC